MLLNPIIVKISKYFSVVFRLVHFVVLFIFLKSKILDVTYIDLKMGETLETVMGASLPQR